MDEMQHQQRAKPHHPTSVPDLKRGKSLLPGLGSESSILISSVLQPDVKIIHLGAVFGCPNIFAHVVYIFIYKKKKYIYIYICEAERKRETQVSDLCMCVCASAHLSGCVLASNSQ